METITMVKRDLHYNCPFSRSCNVCNLLTEQGMNTCPGWDEDTDEIITPADCPLLKESILIRVI